MKVIKQRPIFLWHNNINVLFLCLKNKREKQERKRFGVLDLQTTIFVLKFQMINEWKARLWNLLISICLPDYIMCFMFLNKWSNEATGLFLLVWIWVKNLNRRSFILTVPFPIILLKFEVIYYVHHHINLGFFPSCSSDHSILYQQIIALWDIHYTWYLRV